MILKNSLIYVNQFFFFIYNKLREFYSNAKVFLLFSKSDQWGLVVNEAMASGLPCIVSTECGCYEDLIKNKN